MAIVNVVTIAAYQWIYWLKLIVLVQRLAASCCCATFSQMNQVNSRNGGALTTAP